VGEVGLREGSARGEEEWPGAGSMEVKPLEEKIREGKGEIRMLSERFRRKEGKEKKLSRPSVQKIKNVAKSWDVFDERKKLKEKLTLLQQQLL